MFNIDILIILLSCIQPLIISLILIQSLYHSFSNNYFFNKFSSIKNKNLNTKMYECSTNSRLTSKYVYNIYTFTSCLTFLIYDIDILYFLPETCSSNTYNINSLIILIFLFFLLYAGILFDHKYSTFNWKI